MHKLTWCFGIKEGLKKVEPDDDLSKSYLEQAKSSLLRAEKDLNDNDLLWSTVAIYYSEYYALYAFLRKIGFKCENHACSILAVSELLGEDNIKTINSHIGKRIDAQYYMKVDQEENVKDMLQEAKLFVSSFDNLISELSDSKINEFRDKLSCFKAKN